MASFKGDQHYRSYYDDGAITSEEEEVETKVVHELASKAVSVSFGAWMNEHFDALSDLYDCFKRDGVQVFGRPFHQLGTFADFAEFIFKHTVLQPPDLLKDRVGIHVSAMGFGSRR